MKIVLIGSGGRLGAALAREWAAKDHEIVEFNHQSLDLGDDAALHAALDPLDFDVLVNSAALTNVDYCETNEAEAYRINSDAVRTIGTICAGKGCRCLHISTDYVFDGEKQGSYLESDPARPLGKYGASKLAGEQALLETSDQHLVIRVSWVFGPDRPSFVDQILQRAKETDQLSAVADKWAVPTYTLDLAQWMLPLLQDVPASGLLHLANTGRCSWQEYGQFAIDCAAERGLPLVGRTVAPLQMSDLKAFIARRPVNTVMSTERFTSLTGITPRSWQDAVSEYVAGKG